MILALAHEGIQLRRLDALIMIEETCIWRCKVVELLARLMSAHILTFDEQLWLCHFFLGFFGFGAFRFFAMLLLSLLTSLDGPHRLRHAVQGMLGRQLMLVVHRDRGDAQGFPLSLLGFLLAEAGQFG